MELKQTQVLEWIVKVGLQDWFFKILKLGSVPGVTLAH